MAPPQTPGMAASGTPPELDWGTMSAKEVPVPGEESPAVPEAVPEAVAAPEVPEAVGLSDLFDGAVAEKPWQHQRYSANNRTWQAVGLKRRAHVRRSNRPLGTCTVGLSGPHEPTPRPGNLIHKRPASYFLVLSVRPDDTLLEKEAKEEDEEEPEAKESGEGEPRPSSASEQCPEPGEGDPKALSASDQRPLLYAALLSQKSEATEAIKKLLAKVRDDHAHLPDTLCFRLHSDRGGEFVNEDLIRYCAFHGINKTTTQGHDPDANASAENAVGVLKRRARYLLT